MLAAAFWNWSEAKIAAINLHTNLDVCPGGVNDALAETAGPDGCVEF